MFDEFCNKFDEITLSEDFYICGDAIIAMKMDVDYRFHHIRHNGANFTVPIGKRLEKGNNFFIAPSLIWEQSKFEENTCYFKNGIVEYLIDRRVVEFLKDYDYKLGFTNDPADKVVIMSSDLKEIKGLIATIAVQNI